MTDTIQSNHYRKRFAILIALGFILATLNGCSKTNWRDATREPAGLSLHPSDYDGAVIEFYAADAFSWRGWFAVHSWFAIKERDDIQYTVYEVVGWRVNRGLPALKSYRTKYPDRYWFGAKPEKFLSITGPQAEKLIPQIIAATERYPWANEYKVFPGPNSNTFPAWIGQQVPELKLDMPFRAIGSGFIN